MSARRSYALLISGIDELTLPKPEDSPAMDFVQQKRIHVLPERGIGCEKVSLARRLCDDPDQRTANRTLGYLVTEFA